MVLNDDWVNKLSTAREQERAAAEAKRLRKEEIAEAERLRKEEIAKAEREAEKRA